MKSWKLVLPLAGLLLPYGLTVFNSVVQGQDRPVSQEPKTKIEAFEAQSGSVLIRGFSQIGQLKGAYGGTVTVQSIEFTLAASGKKEYGISIDVGESGTLERSNRSFIDYDEIDPLLKGIDYVAKVDGSATKLANFQADYRTRGDFRVSTFSSPKGIMTSVESGSIGSTSIFLTTSALGQFREIISNAKAKLDSIK